LFANDDFDRDTEGEALEIPIAHHMLLSLTAPNWVKGSDLAVD
jgi:hypothetical protein